MKQFGFKIVLFGFISVFCILGFLTYYHITQKATIDAYYRRFTNGRFPSLLLGSSRTAQGLRPDVFDQELGANFDTPTFNYSFTMGTSNIGPTYLRKIKKRIKNSENSLFVLCVDPWILTHETEDLKQETFKEKETYFGKQITQNMSPNIEYMLFHDDKNQSFFKKIFYPDSSIYYLHENGWLQVNYDNTTKEAIDNSNWQIKRYQGDTNKYVLSDTRFDVLIEMIQFLKSKGTVVIVRLPTGKEVKSIEEKTFPDFDSRVSTIALKQKVNYINLISESGNYQTVDGNHIYKDETEELSKRVCDLIKEKVNLQYK